MPIILDLTGWLDGITSAIIVFTSLIFGIYYIYKGRKLNAKLLTVGGFMAAFTGLLWLGPTFDFFWIIFTPQHVNINNSFGLYGLLSYVWVAPAVTFSMYLGSSLLFPKNKTVRIILVLLFLGIALLFEFIIFFDTAHAFNFTLPENIPGILPGQRIIDSEFPQTSLSFLLIGAILIGVLAINGVGSIIATIKGTGLVRKKFAYLSITWFLFVTVAVFDSLLPAGIFLFIARMGMVVEVLLLYLALKP